MVVRLPSRHVCAGIHEFQRLHHGGWRCLGHHVCREWSPQRHTHAPHQSRTHWNRSRPLSSCIVVARVQSVALCSVAGFQISSMVLRRKTLRPGAAAYYTSRSSERLAYCSDKRCTFSLDCATSTFSVPSMHRYEVNAEMVCAGCSSWRSMDVQIVVTSVRESSFIAQRKRTHQRCID